MSNTASMDRQIELERKDAAREAYEDAAKTLEQYATNDLYQKVLRLGARIIRSRSREKMGTQA